MMLLFTYFHSIMTYSMLNQENVMILVQDEILFWYWYKQSKLQAYSQLFKSSIFTQNISFIYYISAFYKLIWHILTKKSLFLN